MTGQFLMTAFVLGLAGGVTPGPVLAAVFTEILQSGLRPAMAIVVWALLVETVVGLASLLFLSFLGLPPAVFAALSLVGAGILVWIAVQLWRIRRLDTGERVRYGRGRLSAMIFANGVLWTYWITVCIPQALALGARLSYGEYLFVALVQGGWLLATTGLAFAFSRFRGLLSNPRLVPVVFKGLSAAFLYFALNLIRGSIGVLA